MPVDKVENRHPAVNAMVKLFPMFHGEIEPRSLAIIGCAYLETFLEDAIAQKLPNIEPVRKQIFGTSGPLSSMTAKTDIAFALGRIGPNTRANYLLIARIRNRFAHSFEINSFEDDKVRDLVDNLMDIEPAILPNERASRFNLALLLAIGGLSNSLNYDPEPQG